MARDRPAAPAVVEQRVYGFLEHPLLIADDHVRSAEFHQPFEPIVPVNDAAVKIVKIRGREATAVQRYQRTEIRRDDGNDFQNHPLRAVTRGFEGVNHLQPLGHFLAAHFRVGVAHLLPKILGKPGHIDSLEQLADRFRAHFRDKFCTMFLHRLAVAGFGQEFFVLKRCLTRIDDDVGLEIKHLLDVLERHVE